MMMNMMDGCRHGWALAWSFSELPAEPRRLLDPVVLASTTVNASFPPEYTADLQVLWTQAKQEWYQ